MSNLILNQPTKSMQSSTGAPAMRESFVSWARMVARKDNLKVVFGGAPATNGKVMWLPSLPFNLTEQDLLMVRSDIMHESGHCTDTDFEFFTQFSRKHGPLAQSLLNSIEDVRIEVARAKRYPGAEALIHDSNILMMDTGRCKTGESSAADALSTLCYMQGCVLRGWSGRHEDALQKAIGHLLDHLGIDSKSVIDQCINLLVAEYAGLNSTQDAGELTLKVIDLFKDASEDNAEEQDSNDDSESGDSGDEDSSGDSGEDSGEGESEEGESSSDDKSGDDDSQGGDSSSGDESESEGGSEQQSGTSKDESGDSEGESGDSGSDDSKSGSSEGDGDQKARSSEGEGSEAGDASGEAGSGSGSGQAGDASSKKGNGSASAIAEMLDSDPGEDEVIDYHKAVEELADEVSKGKRPEYQGVPMVPDHSADFSPEAKEQAAASGVSDSSVVGSGWAPKDKQEYKRLEAGVQAKANVLLGQLQVLLRMKTKTEYEPSDRGRLNARKLYRTAFDDNRVFKTESQRVLPAAAVSILTDLSASMGRKDEGDHGPTRLDRALQVQILLMKAMSVIGNPVEIAGFGGRKCNVTTLAKTFDEQPQLAQPRIGGMVAEFGGGTPLAAALMHASVRLSAREESKKVMFIITDGQPAEPDQVSYLMDSLRSEGIHVVSFLVGYSEGSKPSYLANHDVVFVPSINELSARSLSAIKQFCLGS